MPKGSKVCPKCKTIVGCRTYVCPNEKCGYGFATLQASHKAKNIQKKVKLEVTRKDVPDKVVLDPNHPNLAYVVLSAVSTAIQWADSEYVDIRSLVKSMSSRYVIPDESIDIVLKSKVEDLWKARLKQLKD